MLNTRNSASAEKERMELLESPEDTNETPQKSSGFVSAFCENNNDQSSESAPNQLALYNLSGTGTSQTAVGIPESTECYCQFRKSSSAPRPSIKILPSVGAYAVQCSECLKWRLIPTKEKYEQIRETVLREPFVCTRAREWCPGITCDNPADISQDDSKIWAIDKPNIPRPPPGWERLLRIRADRSTKFADIYYIAPSGKSLRSLLDIERYLRQHPEYIRNGVHMSRFSFQTPKFTVGQEDNRKLSRPTNPHDGGFRFSRPLKLDEVNLLAWKVPSKVKDLQRRRRRPVSSTTYSKNPGYPQSSEPCCLQRKTKANKHSSEKRFWNASNRVSTFKERSLPNRKKTASKSSFNPTFGSLHLSRDLQIDDPEHIEHPSYRTRSKPPLPKREMNIIAFESFSKQATSLCPSSYGELQSNETNLLAPLHDLTDCTPLVELLPIKKKKKTTT